MRDSSLTAAWHCCAGLATLIGWTSPAAATASILVFPSTNPPVTITAPPAPTPLSLDLPFSTLEGARHAIIQDGPSRIFVGGQVQAAPSRIMESFEELRDVLHFQHLSGPTPIGVHLLVNGTVLIPFVGNGGSINVGAELEPLGGKLIDLSTGAVNPRSGSCMGVPFPACFEVTEGTPTPLSLDLATIMVTTSDVFLDLEMQLHAFGDTAAGTDLDFLHTAGLVLDLPPGVSVTSDGGFSARGVVTAPEPSSLMVLGAALVFFGALMRRGGPPARGGGQTELCPNSPAPGRGTNLAQSARTLECF